MAPNRNNQSHAEVLESVASSPSDNVPRLKSQSKISDASPSRSYRSPADGRSGASSSSSAYSSCGSDNSCPSSAEIGSENDFDFERRYVTASTQCDLSSDGELDNFDCRISTSTQTSDLNDPVLAETCKLASSVVDHFVGESSFGWGFGVKRTTERTVIELVDQLLYRHEVNIRDMVRQVDVATYEDFSVIVDETLNGEPSWARIITIFAFGGLLAASYHEQGLSHRVQQTKAMLGQCLGEKVNLWVKSQGGWDSIIYWWNKGESLNSKLLKGLLITGLGFGLLSTLSIFR